MTVLGTAAWQVRFWQVLSGRFGSDRRLLSHIAFKPSFIPALCNNVLTFCFNFFFIKFCWLDLSELQLDFCTCTWQGGRRFPEFSQSACCRVFFSEFRVLLRLSGKRRKVQRVFRKGKSNRRRRQP